MTLTLEQRKYFEENGYLIVENFYSAEQCNELIAEAESAVRGIYTTNLSMHEKPGFRNLMLGVPLLSLLDELQQHRMIPIGSTFFFCQPKNPLDNGSGWHQDNYAPKSPVGAYLAVALAMDDADPENGSLIVVPGSHKLGNLPHSPQNNFDKNEKGEITKVYPLGDICMVPDGHAIKPLSYKKGSLVILHALTLHKAKKNMHPTRWRRTIYLNFIKDDAPFWPGWNARRTLIDRPPYLVGKNSAAIP